MVHSPGLVNLVIASFSFESVMMTSENTLLILLNCLHLKFRCSLACFVNKCRSYSLTLTLFSNNNIPPTSPSFYMQNLLHEFLFLHSYMGPEQRKSFKSSPKCNSSTALKEDNLNKRISRELNVINVITTWSFRLF